MGTYDTVIREKVRKERVTLTTNATGTMATTVPIQGEIVKLFYDRNSDLDVGTDLPVNAVVCSTEDLAAQVCTLDYSPVCGDDGVTYGNACGACASGSINYHVSGEC